MTDNRDLRVDRDPETAAPRDPDRGGRRLRLWVNWVLALSTAAGAAIVMIYAFGAVMSTAACSAQTCPNLGPSGIGWGVVFYGAPVVAAVTIVASFFTAARRWGLIVPLCGWALLIADIVILAVTVQQ